MPAVRLIALNGNGGAYTPVSASIAARAVQVVEDGSAAAQGLELQYPYDGFAATSQLAPGSELTLVGAGVNGALGLPAQNAANGAGAFNYRPADVYFQARSATATGTTIRVTETEAM